MSTRRFSTGATRYPRPVSGQIRWCREGTGQVARFDLPPLAKDSLIVPNFSATGEGCNWSATWYFRNGDKHWQLDTVPAPPRPEHRETMSDGAYVDADIDCFVTTMDIEVSFLELRLHAHEAPADALTVIATRAFSSRKISAGVKSAGAINVPALSQMQAPPSIRRRICSPICLAMVMGLDERAATRFTDECYGHTRKLYGIWPRNIRAANARGFIGAIEAFQSLDEAAVLIEGGTPIITSNRYRQGELTGSAVPATAGHLVVLCGLNGRSALVNDPAAGCHEDVAREYDREEFAYAWLRKRGVGYVLRRTA
ncbi:MAG: C39 family peptidase [Gammaproteobacteria bacterium]|nr:C39 family peptidase [Gammaproteobacteria bacterium]MCY4322177.1 C39 family peptidase [Gammaproteobacteria bacterium]